MSNNISDEALAAILQELRDLNGAPPVLSTEDPKAYEGITVQFVRAVRPRDGIEQSILRHIIDATWEIIRYTRHKTLQIEQKFRQRLEFQAGRMKQLKEQAQSQEFREAERKNFSELPIEVQREYSIDRILEDIPTDVSSILKQGVTERDHARALEDSIGYHERLDSMLNTATVRRDRGLEQLDRYRRGLGKSAARVSDEIIEAEFSVEKPAA